MNPEEIKAFWDKYNQLQLPRTPRGEMLRRIIADAGGAVSPVATAPVDHNVFNLTDEDKRFLSDLKVRA